MTTKQQEFQAYIGDTFNKGLLTLMISVGHRLNLFQSLSEMNGPVTVSDLASKTKLQERYLQEWLSSMVTGKIIEYNAVDKTFFLPPEHALFLTFNDQGCNIAAYTQFVPELGGVQEQLIESFKKGGGVGYDKYNRMMDIIDELSIQVYKQETLIDTVLPKLSLDLVQKLKHGIRVADVGCGLGRATSVMAKGFPNSKFVGIDFLESSIEKARQFASDQKLTNIEFQARDDVEALESEPESFDLIMAFDAIHDQAHPRALLQAITNALKPGGYFLMIDVNLSTNLENNINHPIASGMYTVSCSHCMTVSLAQGGEGLGACWGVEKAKSYLQDAGLDMVGDIVTIPSDILNGYFLCRKPSAATSA